MKNLMCLLLCCLMIPAFHASADEAVDIVFLVDISSGDVDLYDDVVFGIIDGPDTIIPRDGTVALGLVFMNTSSNAQVAFPLTVIDSESDIDSFINAYNAGYSGGDNTGCSQSSGCSWESQGGGVQTWLEVPICYAGKQFDDAAAGSTDHVLYVISDFVINDRLCAGEAAEAVRTRSTPVRICAINASDSDNVCGSPLVSSSKIAIMNEIANTPDGLNYNSGQISGQSYCLAPDTGYDLPDFNCFCAAIDPTDTTPQNGTPDICEPQYDTSLPDCNNDGIPDELQQYTVSQELTYPSGLSQSLIGSDFGAAMDTDPISNRIIIGSPTDKVQNGSFTEETGAAYVYERQSDGTWAQLGGQILPPSPAADWDGADFGAAVAIDADRILVGAPRYEGDGAAVSYTLNSGSWVQETVFDLPSTTGTPLYGSAIDLKDDRMLIGAPQAPTNFVEFYRYDSEDPNYWVLEKTFTQSDTFRTVDSTSPQFGKAVALMNNFIAIASPAYNPDGDSSGEVDGIVHVFVDDSPYYPSNTAINGTGSPGISLSAVDNFGNAVDAEGDFLAVGCADCNFTASDAGAVMVYEFEEVEVFPGQYAPSIAEQWRIATNMIDRELGDEFGFSLDLSFGSAAGATLTKDIVVSAISDSNPAGSNKGSAYHFRQNASGDWDFQGKLLTEYGPSYDTSETFGQSVGYLNGVSFVSIIDKSAPAGLDDLQLVEVFGSWDDCGTSGCNDADLNSDGQLNFFDVSAFIIAFNEEDSVADFNNDSSFNFFDVSAFITEYNTGCP